MRVQLSVKPRGVHPAVVTPRIHLIRSLSVLGETLDRKYKLVRLLGEGGMGSVYEAEHADARRVAVKVISSRLLVPGSDGIPRFRREARAAGAIDSEHIVQVLDSGHDEATGLLYLVMELLQGEDVQRLIDRCGPLAPDGALRIAAQALVGLQKAHEACIIHRDIKPANLFLARGLDGTITVKLLDFGIAKIKADPVSLPHTTGLTTTGGILGSPLYMSPEQIESSRDVDHGTDLWSLGSSLYCALAGRAPHQDVGSIGKLLVAICASRPPPLQEIAPWVPLEVAKVVHRALERRPEARYANAAAMLEAIRPLLSGDLTLREQMLVSVSAERRTTAAALPGVRLLIDADVGKQIHGDETTAPLGGAAVPLRVDADTGRPILGDDTKAPLGGAASGTATAAHETPPPVLERTAAEQARRTRSRASLLSIALLAAGVGAAAAHKATSSPESHSAAYESAQTASSTASSGLPETSAPNALRWARLAIVPDDGSVEVDGAPVPVTDGVVELRGELGSIHRVRLRKGAQEIEGYVVIAEDGPVPSKLEIIEAPLPRAAPPGTVATPLSPRAAPRRTMSTSAPHAAPLGSPAAPSLPSASENTLAPMDTW